MEFTNRVAVITGGGSGIGRAVAAAMARRGVAAVALVDMSEAVEDVEAEFTGGDVELGMNARYIMDVFSVIEQEKVVIEMNEILSPTLVRPLGDDGYRCVVMPMRL